MASACRTIAVTTVAATVFSFHAALAQQAGDSVKRFGNSIVTAEPGAGSKYSAAPLKDSVRASAKLQLHFSLSTRNFEELQARVARGERISPTEMSEKYSGDAESATRLTRWLGQQGFSKIEASADRTSVYATGTVAQIEKSLGVTMKSVTFDGETRPAAITPPALPREVGDAVIAIDGLQPWTHMLKHSIRPNNARTAFASAHVEVRNAAAADTYKIYDILKAYDAQGLEVAGKGRVTGKGQTIAILIDTLPLRSDVNEFWRRNSLPMNESRVQFINVRGANAELPPRDGEETLDTEWASGIAPGANVRVYAAGSLEWVDIYRAMDRIYADAQKPDGPRHLSLSFGAREDFFTLDQLSEAMFLKLAAIGVSTFVASGDAGSNPDETLSQNAGATESIVEYPASDRWVLAVGGTTLRYRPVGSLVVSETAWSGSGGGVSRKRAQPEWQKSVWTDKDNRLVPDVSSVADTPGAFIIYDGAEQPIWGTSWSAPMWAGFSALIAEAREKQGKTPIGFLAPALYRLKPGAGFRDIVSGSNGAYKAGPGWDPVTGLGVPNVKGLIDTLP